MKNFSTAALLLGLATSFLTVPAHAQTSSTTNSANARCTFLPNAPDQHVVVRGDTLWDISGKFLVKPWCWPRVWDMNRDQIRNPHWIYPGQVVYFDRVAGRLRIGGGGAYGNGETPTVRLSPRVRGTELPPDAIASIPLGEIAQFLTQPLIVDADELANAPRIVATRESRVVLGNNDRAYVRGELNGKTSFNAFRPGVPLKDPETGNVIGYEAVFLGTLNLVRTSTAPEEPHSFDVSAIKQEMMVGDRLQPIEPTPFINYVPHPPERSITARVVSIYGGVSHAGQNQIVTINRGKNDGVDIGTVFQLRRLGRTMVDRTSGETIRLPDEGYGNLFVFRVFNNLSYGLVMQVRDTVQVGDTMGAPD